MDASNHLCYSKCVLKLPFLVFISCSSDWKVQLINCEGARKLTKPIGKWHVFTKFSIFSLPCYWISENKYNHLHLRTCFLEYGNGAQGFRCVLCYTVGGYTSGGKNLERLWELPCTYHRWNIAQLLKPAEERQWEKKAGLWSKRKELLSCLFSCSLDRSQRGASEKSTQHSPFAPFLPKMEHCLQVLLGSWSRRTHLGGQLVSERQGL